MASHQRKHVQDETILANMAESIGSTLGTIAAKARALSHSSFVRTAEREGKKFDGKGKTLVRKVKKAASRNPKNPKSKQTSRRSLHPTTIVGKQEARSISPRKKTAHRIRRRK
jgi:hypothetical protein